MTPVVALFLAACSPAQADDDTVVLANARIVTVCGAEIPKGSLIIVKGKIVDIVPAGEKGGIQPGNIVDLAGKTIIPGLINAGCTVGIAGVANVGTDL